MEIKDIIKEIDEVKQEHKLITNIYIRFSERLDNVLKQCWSYKDDEKETLKVKKETFEMLKTSKELLTFMETKNIETKEFKELLIAVIICFSIIFCLFIYVFHNLQTEIYNLEIEQIHLEKTIDQYTKTNKELNNLIKKNELHKSIKNRKRGH